jgi:hypothetical protein
MAQQKICRHDGYPNEQAHLNPTDADTRLQRRHQFSPQCHLAQLVSIPKLNFPKLSICHSDMRIHLFNLPVLNLGLSVYRPRIASTIQMLMQICWLIKEHTPVSRLSAVWQCRWQQLWTPQQPDEWTCKWLWSLIEKHEILEIIITYLYVLLMNNVVIKKKVNENARKAARTM